ncbi:MAG TPA: hypothetical protein VNG34_02925 [Actinomycetota bacterium]|jgi:hypothetical protein|nr:hypothetical protein [Actinomycetota bacterium]
MGETERIIYDDKPASWYPDNGFTQWEAISRSQERLEDELSEGESLGRYTGQFGHEMRDGQEVYWFKFVVHSKDPTTLDEGRSEGP